MGRISIGKSDRNAGRQCLARGILSYHNWSHLVHRGRLRVVQECHKGYKTHSHRNYSKTVSRDESSNEVYLSGIGRWQEIDSMRNATYVIICSGCTRAMGSRMRIVAFVNECRNKGSQLYCDYQPCLTQFRFVNSPSSQVYERLVVHFPTDPPCKNEIEIVGEGNVPILLSLKQMRNLYMEFKHSPQVDYLTCAAFGMKDYPIPISTTNHLLLDLANLKTWLLRTLLKITCNT